MPERLNCNSGLWRRCHADHVGRYLYAAQYVLNKDVFDAGTGVGYGAAILKASGARTVHGVDICPQTIDEAKGKFENRDILFTVDDCEHLNTVNGPFDIICSFEAIEHLKHPEKFLARCHQLLNPEGTFFCSTPDRATMPEFQNGKPANPFHLHEWYKDEFFALLSNYFDNVDLRTQVITTAYQNRRNAIESLLTHLSVVRFTPIYQLKKFYYWLRGRQLHWIDTWNLDTASVSDYPIYCEGIAEVIGTPFCHFAICTLPNKKG